MRLFVAIPLADNIKDYLIKIQKAIGNKYASTRWVRKNQMHLTLKFLGEVSPQKAEKVRKALETISVPEFKIWLSHLGFFKSEAYIRVLWLGIAPEKPVISLQKEIDTKIEKFFQKERQFKPHITLGRVRAVMERERLISCLKMSIEEKPITVNKFCLVQSFLSKEGPTYKDIAVFA